MKLRILVQGIAIFSIGSLLTGCFGAASHNLELRAGYVPPSNARIEAAPVINDTGEQFDFDICSELRNQLNLELTRQHLDIVSMTNAPELILQARILDYEKGSAAERWLMPGYGGTRLIIQARLSTSNGDAIGTVHVVRSVETGGLYSIGEWKAIFATAAKDIVTDLKAKLPNKTE